MHLIYDDGCYGQHRYGPVCTVLQTAETSIIQKMSSEDLAQLVADLLTLPQELLLGYQQISLVQFLIRYGRSRLGGRFDQLLTRRIAERLREIGFIIVESRPRKRPFPSSLYPFSRLKSYP